MWRSRQPRPPPCRARCPSRQLLACSRLPSTSPNSEWLRGGKVAPRLPARVRRSTTTRSLAVGSKCSAPIRRAERVPACLQTGRSTCPLAIRGILTCQSSGTSVTCRRARAWVERIASRIKTSRSAWGSRRRSKGTMFLTIHRLSTHRCNPEVRVLSTSQATTSFRILPVRPIRAVSVVHPATSWSPDHFNLSKDKTLIPTRIRFKTAACQPTLQMTSRSGMRMMRTRIRSCEQTSQ